MSTVRERPVQAFWIDDYEVDPNSLTLTGPAGETSLEPKIMEVLVELATYAGEVVTRQDLVERVWKVSFGGDESLTRAISILRKQLKPAEGQEDPIETVPRRGYKLRAEVRLAKESGPQSVKSPGPAMASPDLAEGLFETDARRGSRLFALFSIPAAIILMIGLWVFFATTDRDQSPSAVLAELDLPADVRAYLESQAPGFSQGLEASNRRWNVLSDDLEFALYRLSLRRSPSADVEALAVALSIRSSGEELYSANLPFSDQAGEDFAMRLLVRVSHVMRCGNWLMNDVMTDEASNLALMSRLFAVCDSTGIDIADNSLNVQTESVLGAFPESAGAKALHAVALLLRPQQHWFGQRDIREDENLRTIEQLLSEAKAAGHDSSLLVT
ncbi:MAG: hypothetical protein CMK09_15995, partial [Ponticaulis sp.]|nr:hypothetical protein [Ponticaulis sp.]